MQGAEADGSAIAVQISDLDAVEGSAGSVAADVNGNWAETVVELENGKLNTVQSAEADGSATAVQISDLDAESGFVVSGAANQYGYTIIQTDVINGTLYSMSGAFANEDIAFSAQYLDATGTYIYRLVEAYNNAGPYDNDTIELEDGTVIIEEISTAMVNEISAVVTVVAP